MKSALRNQTTTQELAPPFRKGRFDAKTYLKAFQGLRVGEARPQTGPLVLSETKIVHFQHDLCNYRALPIRAMLAHLGFNEGALRGFGLEHKLLQHHALSAFLPMAALPVTTGLAAIVGDRVDGKAVQAVEAAMPNGYVVKPALGYGSKREQILESGNITVALKQLSQWPTPNTPIDERFVVQQKVNARAEYRVHTFGRKVIPTLTFRTHSTWFDEMTAPEKRVVNQNVASWLNLLPEALVHQTLLAWDVAEGNLGCYHVIEINLTGMHTLYEPGFHCSGRLLDAEHGDENIARFCEFVGVDIMTQWETPDLISPENHQLDSRLLGISRWRRLFKAIKALSDAHNESYHPSREDPIPLRTRKATNLATDSELRYLSCIDYLYRTLCHMA